MKKIMLTTICFICIMIIRLVFTYSFADYLPNNPIEHCDLPALTNSYDGNEDENPSVFTLPALLTIIEDGAFEGTAITSVELPENVTTVGDYAFAGIKTLRKVSIPAATTFIGTNAFKDSDQVILTGVPKSYVRVWARNNNLPFDPITSFYAYVPVTYTVGLIYNETRFQGLLSEETAEINPKAQLIGRIMGELNADKYEEITSFHIQGRAPPMG